MTDYNYDGGDDDFNYEVSGATGEEFEHADGCDWIYDNCTCGMTDTLHTLKESLAHVCEDKDSCWYCQVSEHESGEI